MRVLSLLLKYKYAAIRRAYRSLVGGMLFGMSGLLLLFLEGDTVGTGELVSLRDLVPLHVRGEEVHSPRA